MGLFGRSLLSANFQIGLVAGQGTWNTIWNCHPGNRARHASNRLEIFTGHALVSMDLWISVLALPANRQT